MINIVEKIDAEIARLQMARTALSGAAASAQRSPRSVKGTAAVSKETVEVAKSAPKKRQMSAAGRERIAAAQKARWAKLKKASKAPIGARKVAAKKQLSPAKSAAVKKRVVSRAV